MRILSIIIAISTTTTCWTQPVQNTIVQHTRLFDDVISQCLSSEKYDSVTGIYVDTHLKVYEYAQAYPSLGPNIKVFAINGSDAANTFDDYANREIESMLIYTESDTIIVRLGTLFIDYETGELAISHYRDSIIGKYVLEANLGTRKIE